jgi:hypothetical protein
LSAVSRFWLKDENREHDEEREKRRRGGRGEIVNLLLGYVTIL